MTSNIKFNNLLFSIEENIAQIKQYDAPFELVEYISKYLPVNFPNKGILGFIKSLNVIEIHHELFSKYDFFKNFDSNSIESFIDLYGSCHQREYCIITTGHRFDNNQSIYIRGILGYNRLYKLILMLRLLGFDKSKIMICDHKPDYIKIIENDLNQFPLNTDIVIIGGLVVIKRIFGKAFNQNKLYRGDIISFAEYSYKGKSIALTTFPYGDLCEYVVKCLSIKKINSVVFIGSAGTLNNEINVNDIIIPKTILNIDGSILTNKFQNIFRNINDCNLKYSNLHTSAITPLIETDSYLNQLIKNGCETIDVEGSYFQKGCENWLSDTCKVGLMFHITDRPLSKNNLSRLDYASSSNKIVRDQMASVLINYLTTIL